MGIIFIIELAVGIAACLFKADLNDALRNSLEKSIARSSSEDIVAWDNVQRKLMCCGVTGPADWADLSKERIVRSSCCRPSQLDSLTNDCARSAALFKDRYFQVGGPFFLSFTMSEMYDLN